MSSASDRLDDDVSINKNNRHQYYETAVATNESDREIRAAEIRGAERQMREEALRRSIRRVAWRLVVLLVIGAASLALWLARRH